jgi:hypothetical protein
VLANDDCWQSFVAVKRISTNGTTLYRKQNQRVVVNPFPKKHLAKDTANFVKRQLQWAVCRMECHPFYRQCCRTASRTESGFLT